MKEREREKKFGTGTERLSQGYRVKSWSLVSEADGRVGIHDSHFFANRDEILISAPSTPRRQQSVNRQ